MFSMFFGAGNVVFPLALGQHAQSMNLYAILGMIITAVGVPFAGLIAMTLFDGNYKTFFARIGVIPGFIVSAIIMALIGPFGAIPRCIALSYSTSKMYMPGISLELFSAISCVLIFALTVKRNKILDILGYYLTPLLLGSLAIIIVKGYLGDCKEINCPIGQFISLQSPSSPAAPEADHTAFAIFLTGLKEGYQTMDLLGAFFFCSVVITCLKESMDPEHHGNHRKIVMLSLRASLIGATLLTLVYIGFSYVAAFNSGTLAGVPKDELIGVLSVLILGDYASLVAITAVALACVTTAIALASVFAEFLHHDVLQNMISYKMSLGITLVITFLISTLNFTGIAQILAPILHVCYPALIVLSLLNIAYKLHHFKPVKIPVAIAFILTLTGLFL